LSIKETELGILASFQRLLERHWYDEISLDAVAEGAGTTRQTIVRRFDGKAALLGEFAQRIAREIEASRGEPPRDDPAAAAAAVVTDYETSGDMVMRLAALQQRSHEVAAAVDAGRLAHTRWVERAFESDLRAFDDAERTDRLSALLVATDVRAWFLLRRAQKRTRAETMRVMTAMIARTLQI